MCEFGTSFKLCSCSGQIDRTKPHWVLERVTINLKDVKRVIIGMFPPNYHFSIQFVLSQLNSNNPFDFDYQPKQKDTLSLYFESDVFNLIYTNGKWRDFYHMYVGLDEDEKLFKQEGEIVNP